MPLVTAGQRITAAMLNKSYSLADSTATTRLNATPLQNLSTAYTIPANDAVVNTVYRLSASGTGTEAGTTALGGTIQTVPNCVAAPGFNLTAAQIAAAGASFRWRAMMEIIIVTTGAGGTADVSMLASFANTGGTIQTPIACALTAQAFNTTIANAISIQWYWAATTNAPTITCNQTVFEKLAG